MVCVLVASVGLFAFGASPVANNDSYSMNEDDILTVPAPGVLANDTDEDGDSLTAELVWGPSDGTLTLNPDGLFTYEPNADFSGEGSFTYRAHDGTEFSNVATVTITVHPVNDAPVAADQFLTTQMNTPVRLTLGARDPDVDPQDPGKQPLVFAILSGPEHGVLSGDISLVRYELPHAAFVELTYTPDTGFVGTDRITFSVTDPFGAVDVGVVEIEVVRRLPFGKLSGTWDSSLTFHEPPPEIKSFNNTLTGLYWVDSFSLQARATLREASFSSLNFAVDSPLGEKVKVHSTLDLSPDKLAFNYWQTVIRFDLFGLDCTHTFHLPSDYEDAYNSFVARGRVEKISFTSTTRFTGLGFDFETEELRVRWDWPACDLRFDARLQMLKEGFESFSITMSDVQIPRPVCEGFDIYLQLEAEFTTTNKEFTPTFSCRSGWICCLRPLCEVITDEAGTSIEGISFYGLRLRLTSAQGIELRADTSFLPKKNASVTGYSDYFEMWMLSGPTLPCCGSPGRWQIATYFGQDQDLAQLFGWGMTRFTLITPVSEPLSVSTELMVKPAEWELDLGWKLRF